MIRRVETLGNISGSPYVGVFTMVEKSLSIYRGTMEEPILRKFSRNVR
jgi:hypothetical protein